MGGGGRQERLGTLYPLVDDDEEEVVEQGEKGRASEILGGRIGVRSNIPFPASGVGEGEVQSWRLPPVPVKLLLLSDGL